MNKQCDIRFTKNTYPKYKNTSALIGNEQRWSAEDMVNEKKCNKQLHTFQTKFSLKCMQLFITFLFIDRIFSLVTQPLATRKDKFWYIWFDYKTNVEKNCHSSNLEF